MEGRTASEDVLEADVKGGVRVGGEDGPRLANDISGASVLVAVGIADLPLLLAGTRPQCSLRQNAREC